MTCLFFTRVLPVMTTPDHGFISVEASNPTVTHRGCCPGPSSRTSSVVDIVALMPGISFRELWIFVSQGALRRVVYLSGRRVLSLPPLFHPPFLLRLFIRLFAPPSSLLASPPDRLPGTLPESLASVNPAMASCPSIPGHLYEMLLTHPPSGV